MRGNRVTQSLDKRRPLGCLPPSAWRGCWRCMKPKALTTRCHDDSVLVSHERRCHDGSAMLSQC
ncbi:hypothetical protein HaLaN_28545 [Haematococcus lacustris]|uniref:Uncharacterized protein n=1 Tax=Haematococcus lacustris TaxID=44745 RepID=A0A6A0ADA3_HAELA|nr:hypothetical protein HaLaN_28545 [Haematococcus lacustris]